jgi:hypothetical protein
MEKLRQLNLTVPEHVYLRFKVRAMMRKMTMSDLFIEMVQWGPSMPKEEEVDERIYATLKDLWDKTPKPQPAHLSEMEQQRRSELSEMVSVMQQEGKNNSEIARELDSRGIPTPSGRGKWHRTMIKRILDQF